MDQKLLTQLEGCVRERRYNEAGNSLIPILGAIEGGSKSDTTVPSEADATRLAAAITQILTDTSVPLSKGIFLELNRFKRCMTQAFQVSGYRGTSHFLKMLGKTAENGASTYNGQELLRLFTGLSINAITPELCDAFLRLDPPWSFPIMIGYLSEQLLYTPQAELARSKLLASGYLWENIDPDFYNLRAEGKTLFSLNIVTAYMGCSYADAPHKHEIKKCMNKIVRRWLEKNGVKDTPIPAKRPLKKRPKLVTFAEFYSPFHAMHRCYGPSIESLKEDFDTTMIIANTKPHPELDKLAHKVETLDLPNDNPIELIAKLQALEPDILYLPSVGMRFSSIAVSNVRIAPIQVMTFGHPATTHSDAMDYVILNSFGQNPATISEKIVDVPSLDVFSPRSDAVSMPPNIRLDPEVVRIAVPAWSRKVTPRFLETCQRIQRTTKKKVEFWFFPNALGYLYQAVKRRYEGILPGSVVLPTKNYNDYIRDLNQCDIFLSTFPFGATNGLVDALLQGLPVVNLVGDEVHSCSDSAIVSLVDQPTFLSAKTIDDYVNAVVRLLEDPALRVQISRNILDKNPAGCLFIKNGKASEFAQMFHSIYKAG